MNRLISLFVFSMFLLTCTKEIEVYDSPANEQLELPLLLTLNQKPVVLDMATSTIKYVVAQTAYADYEVFMSFQENTRILFEGQEWTNNAMNDLGDIEINKAYELEFISNEQHKHFQLIFTNLPIVQLVVHDKVKNEPKSLARMIVLDNDDTAAPMITPIGIEKRGASSIRNPKNSYGFKPLNSLNTRNEGGVDIFNMGYSSSWILDALYIDESKFRNQLCFEIWGSMNANNMHHHFIESKFVEVYFNYESYGLYAFNENFNLETLDLNGNSVLYAGKDIQPDTKFIKLPKQEPKTSFWGSWEQKFPDPKERIDWHSLHDFSKLVIEGSDADFEANIDTHADMDLLVDYYLFVNLIFAYDNLGKNYLFLKEDANQKLEVIPWDLDATLGRDHNGVTTPTDVIVSNNLFDRLIHVNPNNYKQQLKTRWLDLRQDEYAYASLSALIDAKTSVLKASDIIAVDNAVWDRNTDILQEEAYVLNWLQNRLIFLDDYFANL